MTRTNTLIAVLSFILIAFCSWKAFAQIDEPPTLLKEKSVGVALLLGLDPIPGDSLFYAGKTTQGAINAVFGGTTGILFWVCLINAYATQRPASEESWESLGWTLGAIGSGAIYVPMLIWDLAGGVAGTVAHNKKVQDQKLSWIRTVRPSFAVLPNGGYAGLQWKF